MCSNAIETEKALPVLGGLGTVAFVKMQHAEKCIQFGAAQLGKVVIESA